MLSFHCETLIHSLIRQIFLECLLVPDAGVGAIKATKSKTKFLCSLYFGGGGKQLKEQIYNIMSFWIRNKKEKEA